MNKILALTLALIFTSTSAIAETDFPETRKISVSGKANTKVTPDKATISFAVISREDSAEQTRKENAKTTKDVLNSLRKMKIKDNAINLNSLNINERREYDKRSKKYELVGFEARRRFTVEVTDLEQVPEIITRIVQKGSNQLNSLNYGLQNPELHKNTVLELALKNAKEKAKLLVKSIDAKLGDVLIINESSISHPISAFPVQRSAMLMDSAKAEVEPEAYSTGDLEINASINAIFEII